MSFFIEEDTEDAISADDWSGIVCCPRERARADLERQIEEFQRNGGAVQEIPVGVVVESAFSPTITSGSSKFTQAEIKAHAKRKADNLHYKVRTGDAEAVVMLGTLLDIAPNATFLARQLNCSFERVQRLLAEHFSGDRRADKFLRKDRDTKKAENEAEIAAKIKAALADGVIGAWSVAKLCGASFATVAKVSKKYRLHIPRGRASRSSGVSM